MRAALSLVFVGLSQEFPLGVRIRGTLGDIEPLNKIPCKKPKGRVKSPL